MIICGYEVFTSEGVEGFSTLGPALEAAWAESKSRQGTPTSVYVQIEGSDAVVLYTTVIAHH